ncbi:MAG TPA: SIMPL domain-containing protein [Mycobacteriales bacterium]|jgi:hypothetical protein|nr:SIMPL domain-containing protein [Mycobacteriales bacterium]
MDETALVSVRGEAVLEVDPELASLNVVVRARDKERDRTLTRLDARSGEVLALVASFGAAVDRVETEAVHIGPELKDGRPNERITGYAAVVRHTVVVVDFTRLGDLTTRLAELELVTVSGPWWRLRPGSPVHRDARAAAAADAVTRAREYAAALGSRLVGLVELADTGLLADSVSGPVPVAPMAAMAPRAGGGAPAPVVLDVEPVKQVVRASVEARFAMTQPPAEVLG